MDGTAKLYGVHSTVDGWKHRRWFYDGVTIHWLAVREAPERHNPPWTEVPVYDADTGERTPYLAAAVDELFTREEAEALVAYLKETYKDDTARISEYPTPVPANHGPLTMGGYGGSVDGFILKERREGYPFDFDVEGYYDVRHLEPTHREPYRECAAAGCSEDGVHIWIGHGADAYEKGEGGWVHMCEKHRAEHDERVRAEYAAKGADTLDY